MYVLIFLIKFKTISHHFNQNSRKPNYQSTPSILNTLIDQYKPPNHMPPQFKKPNIINPNFNHYKIILIQSQNLKQSRNVHHTKDTPHTSSRSLKISPKLPSQLIEKDDRIFLGRYWVKETGNIDKKTKIIS